MYRTDSTSPDLHEYRFLQEERTLMAQIEGAKMNRSTAEILIQQLTARLHELRNQEQLRRSALREKETP